MSWKKDLLGANEDQRKKLVEMIDEQCSDLYGSDPSAKRIEFISNDADLVGFTSQITNMKLNGNKKIYDYVLATPALVFASKTCPCSIIVSPDLSKQMKQAQTMSRDEYQAICSETFHMGQSQGVILALNWFLDLSEARRKHFEIAKNNALTAILNFKKGKISPIGRKFVDTLSKDFNLIGFSPNIIYVKCTSQYNDELGVEWCHPFSQPTLLYQHKSLPVLLQVNGNIDFNETRLAKNADNLKDKNLAQAITNLAGFTG